MRTPSSLLLNRSFAFYVVKSVRHCFLFISSPDVRKPHRASLVLRLFYHRGIMLDKILLVVFLVIIGSFLSSVQLMAHYVTHPNW